MAIFKKHWSFGFTLVETIIAVAFLMIIMVGIAGVVRLAFKSTHEARARITATALANERIETVRNLPYGSIGTVNGVPSGTIPQTEARGLNGINYTIKTAINYVDDPFDGLAPVDTLNTDYKSVRVEVTWGGPASSSRPVLMYTKATPKGLETPVSGGTIIIHTFDSSAQPVSGATVHLVGTGLVPPVDITQNTDVSGIFSLPGAPACNGCYQVTVSKVGFSTERTYSTAEVHAPLNPNLTVIDQQLTETSFAIDRVSTLTIITEQPAPQPTDPPLPLFNLTFTLVGAKILGTDSGGLPVYKFSNSFSSGGTGTLVLTGLEWDSYSALVNGATTGFDLASSTPFEPPMAVNANSSVELKMLLEPHTLHSLRAYVTDSAGLPLNGATVRVFLGGYDTTHPTNSSGQAFFSGLDQSTYNIEATMAGFELYAGTTAVNGATISPVMLNPL